MLCGCVFKDIYKGCLLFILALFSLEGIWGPSKIQGSKYYSVSGGIRSLSEMCLPMEIQLSLSKMCLPMEIQLGALSFQSCLVLGSLPENKSAGMNRSRVPAGQSEECSSFQPPPSFI